MSESAPLSRLDGKVALITGAAQGMGEETARLFAARGIAGLLLTDRNAERGAVVAKSLQDQGIATTFVAADLADPSAPERIVAAADAAFGRIDILCNIAGLTDRGGVWDTDLGLWDRMFAINVRAPFFLMQGALRIMVREKIDGTIVNIISVNAHRGASFLTPYSASKGALATLTKNVAHAVAVDRIRVNGLNLGWIATPGEDAVQKRYHGATDDWLEQVEKTRPFGRLVQASDVARAIAYLASAESGLMTGAIIDFDQTVFGPAEDIARQQPG